MINPWFLEFSQALERIPTHIRSASRLASLACNVKEIYRDGTIAGTCVGADRTYRIFVGFLLSGHSMGCECRESRGKSPCCHIAAFLTHLVESLSGHQSELHRKILEQRFTPGHLDYESYKPSMFQLELDALDRVIESRNRIVELPADELSPRLETTVSRIAWDFSLDDRKLRVQPRQQTQGARKDVWSKGRPLPSNMQWVPPLQYSALDREIDLKLNAEQDSISPVEIAMLLVEQSNVLFDGKPIALSKIDLLLELRRSDQRIAVRPVGWHPEHMMFFSEIGGLIILPQEMAMHVFSLNREQSEVMRGLDWMRELPCDPFEEPLIERAKLLQKFLNLRLPDEIGGAIIDESFQVALLLRTHSDGQLDYGFRVRDSDGNLLRPGIGPSVRLGQRGSRKVQWLRSAIAEREAVALWATRLGLDPMLTENQLDSPDDSLALMEKLQGVGEELELLWEKGTQGRTAIVGVLKSENVRVKVVRKRDWFQLDGTCKVGNESIAIAKLMASLGSPVFHTSTGDYIRIEDVGWVKIEEHLRLALQKLRDHLNENGNQLQFDQTSTHAIRGLQDELTIEQNQAWQDCLDRLEGAELFDPIVPKTLHASLRNYQIEGFKWLRRLSELGTGGILADDMGLGKTVQTLALLLDRSELGPTLVIAPTSVGFNWVRETEKFAPELVPILYRESDRDEVLESASAKQLIVITYGLALRDAEKLTKVKWATMVLDEAQAIKNSRGKTSQAIRKFQANWSIALTGTPVENHLGELWSIMHVVSPGVFGSWAQFRQRFAGPIENHGDEERRSALRRRIQPFMLRRTKQGVLKDLPPRTEMNVYVVLSEAERAVYDRIRLSAIGEMDKVAKLRDFEDARFKLLALITRLRQVACHPGLIHETWTEPSAKLIELRETILELREEGHRVLIFSQFTKHLSLIKEMLDIEKVSYQYLDGGTVATERQNQVDLFQKGDAIAFLISLKAGGTGLNLTAADYVIHMDPWWNPAVENQATDRAHRIGQTKPVMVYRFIAKDTIEEEILQLHETKRDLASAILSGAETTGKLSNADLIALIRG